MHHPTDDQSTSELYAWEAALEDQFVAAMLRGSSDIEGPSTTATTAPCFDQSGSVIAANIQSASLENGSVHNGLHINPNS